MGFFCGGGAEFEVMSLPATALSSATLGELFTHMCLDLTSGSVGTSQWAAMLGGWGGNRGPGGKYGMVWYNSRV